MCNKNFSKIIFCLKSEKDEYAKYINDNSKIFYVEDIEDEILLKDIFKKKYDLIIASKVLTKIEKISNFLDIIKKISYNNTRFIIFNKSFLYLFFKNLLKKKKV